MEKLSSVYRWIKESIDRDIYDLWYTLQLYMAGDYEAMRELMDSRDSTFWGNHMWQSGTAYELPVYGYMRPGLGDAGLQNHGLVNARINVQGINMTPAIEFLSDEPAEAEWNKAYIHDLWEIGRWRHQLERMGMDVETYGLGALVLGIENDRPQISHISMLDVIVDMSKPTPRDWGWVCYRKFLSEEEVRELYGEVVDDKELEMLRKPIGTAREGTSYDTKAGVRETIAEWSYYSPTGHVVFLGGIGPDNPESIILKLDMEDGYVRVKNGPDAEVGPNPFGIIPMAFWVDFWAPGHKMPKGKSETTVWLSGMLAEVEKFIIETARNGVPITGVDGTKLTTELQQELKLCRSVEGLRRIIVTTRGGIKDLLTRMEPAELGQTWILLRSLLKEELNAATGVQDMQRGQALAGERRTKFEVESLNDQAGVQARHMRATFADLVEDLTIRVRILGREFDTAERMLRLETFGKQPCQPLARSFLAEDLPIHVDQEKLQFKSPDRIRDEIILEFQTLHQFYIQRGVMDAQKSMQRVMSKFGIKDPLKELGVDQAQLMAMAMQAQQSEAPSEDMAMAA